MSPDVRFSLVKGQYRDIHLPYRHHTPNGAYSARHIQGHIWAPSLINYLEWGIAP